MKYVVVLGDGMDWPMESLNGGTPPFLRRYPMYG